MQTSSGSLFLRRHCYIVCSLFSSVLPYLFLSSRFRSSAPCSRRPPCPELPRISPIIQRVIQYDLFGLFASRWIAKFFLPAKEERACVLSYTFVLYSFLLSLSLFLLFFIVKALPCPVIFHNYAALWATIKIRGACRSRDGRPG